MKATDLTFDRYLEMIQKVYRSSSSEVPEATVVIVSYGTPHETIITSLQKLNDERTEVLVIDNGPTSQGNPYAEFERVTYVAMKGNAGIATGRNLGIVMARAGIIIFLDDDALPADDFVSAHLTELQDPKVMGVRGRCLPRTRNLPNRLAFHYDLGDERILSPIDLEGNSSFRKSVLMECGGFDESLPLAGGHEGVDISYHIIKRNGDQGSLIYSPFPVIYHDYKSNTFQLLRKYVRHRENINRMTENDPEISSFMRQYNRDSNPLHLLMKAVRTYHHK